MKKIILFCALYGIAGSAFDQKETFDLISYTAPKGWEKAVEENITNYTIVNKKNNSWCRINIVKSTVSKGDINQDFESEWQEMIIKNYHPTDAPQLNEIQEADGWKIKAGGAKFIFNNSEAMVLLTTATGYNRCVSIVATANSQDYIKDIEALLESVDLIKPEINTVGITAVNSDKNSILGTWAKTGSVNPDYNDAYATSIAGYTKDQYSFNSNGTYYFVSKTFGMSFSKILLVKENGTYQISGNTITVTPQKAVIEAWSKKDGSDKWGKLLSTQKRILEKTTYQFTKHYFSGIQLWNLVLQNNKATQRDGPHSNNKTFDNAWYYSPISANNTAIELPGGKQITVEEIKKEPLQQFATTNAAILGSWGKSNTVNHINNRFGNYSYNKQQYTFNADGSYSFAAKTYDEQYSETFLIKETGNFVVTGNTIKISPKSSVIEAWSKKNGADNWNQLKSTQKRPLEIVSYQFSVADNNLLLQTAKQTERDGRFNNGNTYRYGPPGTFTPIKLPD